MVLKQGEYIVKNIPFLTIVLTTRSQLNVSFVLTSEEIHQRE